MDCNQTRRLLEAAVDGELDLVHQLEVDAHLRTCPDCARVTDALRARRAALRESLPRFTASTQLAEKIRHALPVAPLATKILFPLWQVAGLAASIAFAGLIGFAWGNARGRAGQVVDEAIADHIRSLQADHLTDVASTDQHTVKPWFAGKLDFAPPVVDLAPTGFPLTGGRLEHLDGRTAAALVFHRRQHAINLFIWPTGQGAALASHRSEHEGYRTEAWSQAGFNFLAVSDVAATELAQFAEAFRANVRE